MKADRDALENVRAGMETQKAEAVELADRMAAEIEQLRGAVASPHLFSKVTVPNICVAG